MVLNGYRTDPLGLPAWLTDIASDTAKTAANSAAGAIGKKLSKQPGGSAPAAGTGAASDNTIRNVALAGGAVVLSIVLVSKILGRRRATNPGRRRRRRSHRR